MVENYVIPAINLIVMAITTVLYTLGCVFYGTRKFSKKLHFRFSFSGWIGTLLFFFIYMLGRSVAGSLSAPDYLSALYTPTLIIHMVTATITLILPALLLFIGLKRRKGKTDRSMKKIGIINVILWYLTFISGIIIFLCLHIFPK
ncbi:hypothetical protein LCGC14_0787360 [marine sediment metagenome]|uniref:DUF420 domain-containing protein n=1 Tax=marine sediment metagenome TaxID=412755 RepID=A0A0F9PTS0_9ZZZZ